ncbi:MAG TPA: biotin--[acetyl-CoA-carboxylase] ligase [Steroidobacteraceae bacterium]|nr:biotin--[acetyl-CoA-carboxylase] ligase [Steroidobacteraceae bacterium]
MSRRGELLRLLRDGERHSGEELAAALAVSRAAVWKQLRSLREWGIECTAERGRGYRLAQPLDLLSAEAIQQGLPQFAAGRLRNLDVHEALASTSDALLAVGDLPAGRFDACLAEFQSAGRGRRGRRWLAPFGSGLCLSVNWMFRDAPAALGALSLAAGVAVLRALASLSVTGAGLKWPNDVVHEGRKLGGILIDLRGEAAGPAYVVVGFGLNTRLSRQALEALHADGIEAVDLATLGLAPRRSHVAALLIGELALALEEFDARGFAAFADEWRDADALAGRPVRVLQGRESQEGVARGVDPDGALVLETGGDRRRILSGDVSVRLAVACPSA